MLPIVLLVAVALAFAGSQGGTDVAGIPLFAACIALAFIIQWIAPKQRERAEEISETRIRAKMANLLRVNGAPSSDVSAPIKENAPARLGLLPSCPLCSPRPKLHYVARRVD